MSRSPESVRNMMQSAPLLRRLGKQIEEQRWLLNQLQQVLPETLAGHCRAVVWSDDRLTLYADSAAWASRLRYAIPELRDWLTPRLPTIRKIRVRIFLGTETTASGNQKPRTTAAKRISGASRRLLIEVADGLGDDELGTVLRRLAQHGD